MSTAVILFSLCVCERLGLTRDRARICDDDDDDNDDDDCRFVVH